MGLIPYNCPLPSSKGRGSGGQVHHTRTDGRKAGLAPPSLSPYTGTGMEALKWIGIVLAAGFVGYFGRYAAMRIIEGMERRRKATTPPPAAGPPPVSDSPDAKLEKKRAKQAVKAAKKAPHD